MWARVRPSVVSYNVPYCADDSSPADVLYETNDDFDRSLEGANVVSNLYDSEASHHEILIVISRLH